MCSFAARAVGSTLWPLTFGPPCAAVRGGRIGPAGGIGRDADSFSPGQEPRRKARPPLTNWPAEPASAKWGCSFFWHCHHLGGYFSLSKQRKVTRPPAGGRKPAAGEPGRQVAISLKPKAKSQKPKAKSQKPKAKSQKPKAKSQKPKAKSQKPKAKSQSHWTPAFAGVTAKERRGEARLFTPHPSPLTPHPNPSSLLKAAAIHGRSPRSPEGRGSRGLRHPAQPAKSMTSASPRRSHSSHPLNATTFVPKNLCHRVDTCAPQQDNPRATGRNALSVASVLSTQGIWTFTLVATSTSASIGCRHCITS